MAKQRGIHQISGIINNLCYYEQKYVRGGLIRRVNEAMSGRLKTDPVFENTRQSSYVFGMCSILAAQIFSCFGNRSSFLFRPSRQAKFTKYLLSQYQAQNGKTARQTLKVTDVLLNTLPMFIDRILKSRLSDYGIYLGNVLEVDGTASNHIYRIPKTTLEQACMQNGVEEVAFIIRGAHNVQMPTYDPVSRRYIAGDVFYKQLYVTQTWRLGDDDLSITLNSGVYDTGYSFAVVTMGFVTGYLGVSPIFLQGKNAMAVVSFKNINN